MSRKVDLRLEGRSQVVGTQLAIVAGVLLIWFVVAARELVSPLLLPKPGDVVVALPTLLADPRTWGHLKITGVEILGAFLFSTITGTLVGFWLGLSRHRTRLLEPFLVSGYMVPIVLLYPIVLLIFGVGPESKVVFAGIYGFFPVALNTMRGFRTVDRALITAAVSLGASTRQRIAHVMIPAAKPMIVAGIRIGAALDLTGVLVGEMLASRAGLGYEIARTAQTFSTAKMYAYIVVALVLIALFNRVIARHG
jgi:ABC-type nitrate/sulfonate/bicarbonate transport system permease component